LRNIAKIFHHQNNINLLFFSSIFILARVIHVLLQLWQNFIPDLLIDFIILDKAFVIVVIISGITASGLKAFEQKYIENDFGPSIWERDN